MKTIVLQTIRRGAVRVQLYEIKRWWRKPNYETVCTGCNQVLRHDRLSVARTVMNVHRCKCARIPSLKELREGLAALSTPLPRK